MWARSRRGIRDVAMSFLILGSAAIRVDGHVLVRKCEKENSCTPYICKRDAQV